MKRTMRHAHPSFVMVAPFFVMPGLDPGIRSDAVPRQKAGSSPAMTKRGPNMAR